MRPISQCLNPTLMRLCEHAITLESLTVRVHDYLRSRATAHCRVGSFNKGCLVLIVDNAAWASEIRYSVPALRDYLRKTTGLHQLVAITVRISTDSDRAPAKKQEKRGLLSNATHDTMLLHSKQCRHPPLKDALLQLTSAIRAEVHASSGNK